jgi:hypothetical protein
MSAHTIAAARSPEGIPYRLQKRHGKFDVVNNRTGLAWRYEIKGASESVARGIFNLKTMTNSKGGI